MTYSVTDGPRMPWRKGRKLRIAVNGKELESVTQFCYLRSMVTEDCRCECEVRRRIALAMEAFNKKKDLMCGSISLQLKKRIVKAFVWSTVLYGSETWTLQKSDIKRIEGFQMWIWRRMLKVPYLGRNTKKNDEVLRTAETKRELMDTLRTRQKKWLGHALRHGTLVKTVLEGRLLRKKGRGRPKEMLLSWLLETSDEVMDYSQLKELAQERTRWCRWRT